MSKRVANCRGKSTAHFGRIRIGWHKSRMLDQMEKLDEAARMGDLEDEAKVKFAEFKEKVKQIIPRKLLQRHQAR